jgi:anti-sigma B factor antagonist
VASSIVIISAILEDPLADPEAVSVEQVEGASVIALRGEHDLSTGPAIEAACDSAWAYSSSIVFDLAGATFIDSTVVGVMVSARRRAAESGGSVAVVAPAGGPPARVLTLVGINDVLPLHETRDEALRTISAPG